MVKRFVADSAPSLYLFPPPSVDLEPIGHTTRPTDRRRAVLKKNSRSEYQKQWRKRNPESHARTCARTKKKYSTLAWPRLLLKYGLSVDDYNRLSEKQNNVCAICGNKNGKRIHLAVDHNHSTGMVRGLLCTPCNIGIGNLKEKPEIIRSAAAYLERRIF